MSPKRLLPMAVVLLSVAGMLVCIAGVVVVWSLASRLSQTSDFVFDGIDKSLVLVGERAIKAQQRAQELKITAEEVVDAVRDRAREKTGELATVRLDIQEKAERLGQGLQQVDSWLEISTQSIENVDQGLEVLRWLGAPVEGKLVEYLLEKLTSLRKQLSEATDAVTEIRTHAADIAEGPTLAERKQQLAQIVARLLVTLGNVDSHLTDLAARLGDMQTKAGGLQSQTLRKIAIAKFALIALLTWLAVGQISLCVHGWRRYRSPATRGLA